MKKKDKCLMFTIDGTIRALRTYPGTINLIKDLQEGNFFNGVIAGLTDAPGMLATASSLCLYDGEDVEHIALLMNDKLAIGTFEWLQDLKIGDEVKLVVSDIPEGPLLIHAILRKNDEVLWMPFSVDHTRRGWIMQGIKLGAGIVISTWLTFGSFYLINGEVPDRLEWNMLIFFPIVLMVFVIFMSLQGVMGLGDEAENIFLALKVPKHTRFRIKSFGIPNSDYLKTFSSRERRYIFNFSEALAAHKEKFHLT